MESITLDDVFAEEATPSAEDTQEIEETKEDAAAQEDSVGAEGSTEEEEQQENQQEEQQEDSEEQEKTVVDELKEHFGYDVEGEFADDVDGLKTFTSEVAKKIVESQFEEYYKQYPIAGEFNDYIVNGGDPEKFFKVNFDEPNYSKIELTEDNDVASKEVLKAFHKEQGFTEIEVTEMLSDYEDTGILYKQASKVLPKLVTAQKNKKENLKEEQRIEVERQQEETSQTWKTIETTVNSGNLNGITVSEADKKKFFEWMAVPTEEGKSSMQVAEESMTLDQMLAFRYLLYKGGNISNLVSNAKNTQQAESLRNRLNKGNNNKLKGSGKQTSNTRGAVLSIEDFI